MEYPEPKSFLRSPPRVLDSRVVAANLIAAMEDTLGSRASLFGYLPALDTIDFLTQREYPDEVECYLVFANEILSLAEIRAYILVAQRRRDKTRLVLRHVPKNGPVTEHTLPQSDIEKGLRLAPLFRHCKDLGDVIVLVKYLTVKREIWPGEPGMANCTFVEKLAQVCLRFKNESLSLQSASSSSHPEPTLPTPPALTVHRSTDDTPALKAKSQTLTEIQKEEESEPRLKDGDGALHLPTLIKEDVPSTAVSTPIPPTPPTLVALSPSDDTLGLEAMKKRDPRLPLLKRSVSPAVGPRVQDESQSERFKRSPAPSPKRERRTAPRIPPFASTPEYAERVASYLTNIRMRDGVLPRSLALSAHTSMRDVNIAMLSREIRNANVQTTLRIAILKEDKDGYNQMTDEIIANIEAERAAMNVAMDEEKVQILSSAVKKQGDMIRQLERLEEERDVERRERDVVDGEKEKYAVNAEREYVGLVEFGRKGRSVKRVRFQ